MKFRIIEEAWGSTEKNGGTESPQNGGADLYPRGGADNRIYARQAEVRHCFGR